MSGGVLETRYHFNHIVMNQELREQVKNLEWAQSGVAGSPDYVGILNAWVSDKCIDAIVDLITAQQVKVLEMARKKVYRSESLSDSHKALTELIDQVKKGEV
jgi:hypothetical protein